MSSRDKILARRAKFIAAAITSAGLVGCGSEVAPTGADAGPADARVDTSTPSDTSPQVCLEPEVDTGVDDTGPQPCLDPAIDSGIDSGMSDASDKDTGPMPCLAPPPDEGAGS